jgi:hypothetical protein
MVRLIVSLAILSLVILFIVSVDAIKDCRRNESQEEEHPCDTCVRWGECNGVDEDCPRRDYGK